MKQPCFDSASRTIGWISQTAVLLLCVLAAVNARAEGLDLLSRVEAPGTRYLGVLVYPLNCADCEKKAAEWLAATERLKPLGVRSSVVLVPSSGASCPAPSWIKTDTICDHDKRISTELGASPSATTFHLWSWTGALVPTSDAAHLSDDVARSLKGAPRVVIDALDEQSRASAELLEKAWTALTEQNKFTLVPRDQQKHELDEAQSRWLQSALGSRKACDFRPGTVPYVLRVKVNGLSRKKELVLTLLSGEVSCTLATTTVDFAPEKPNVALQTGLRELVRKLPRRLEAPMAEGVRETSSAMAKVPAGPFFRGCNEKLDKACDRHEAPGGEVELSASEIDLAEVTVADYGVCVANGKCAAPTSLSPTCNWGKDDREKHPINCVSWDEAAAYCAFKGKRLPTEAEWEKAARGADGRVFPWGNEPADCTRAVMDREGSNGCGSGPSTWPVGTKANGASPYAVLDMAGNVSEWVNDFYEATYYAHGPKSDPKGPAFGEMHVIRGGGYFSPSTDLRVSRRERNSSGMRNGAIGFRCARSAK